MRSCVRVASSAAIQVGRARVELQVALDVGQVLLHQPHGGARVAPRQRLDDRTCSSCECSAECADWYISAISDAAR